MTLRTVNYCVPCKLSCEAEDEVVLCLTGITVPSPICPESVAQETYEYSHINGTIASVTCSKSTYKYVLTYDDVDTSGVILDPQNIDGVLCKGCYTRYVEELVGNEPYIRNDGEGIYTFVSPHGCEYELNTGEGAGITVSDTNSIDLTLTGSALSAASKISATAGNQISVNPDGLYVPAGGSSAEYTAWTPEFWRTGGQITPYEVRAWYILTGEKIHINIAAFLPLAAFVSPGGIFFTSPPGVVFDPINPPYAGYLAQGDTGSLIDYNDYQLNIFDYKTIYSFAGQNTNEVFLYLPALSASDYLLYLTTDIRVKVA